MKFWVFVGLTAIDVSLCGPAVGAQSVLALAPVWIGVVQIFWPGLRELSEPKTAPATGAGASTTLWVKSTGWMMSPPSSASTGPMPTPSARLEAAMRVAANRRRGMGRALVMLVLHA